MGIHPSWEGCSVGVRRTTKSWPLEGVGEAMGILVTAIPEPVRSVPGLSPEFPPGSVAVR